MQTTTKRRLYFFGRNLLTWLMGAGFVLVATAVFVGAVLGLVWLTSAVGLGAVIGAVVLAFILYAAWMDAGSDVEQEQRRISEKARIYGEGDR